MSTDPINHRNELFRTYRGLMLPDIAAKASSQVGISSLNTHRGTSALKSFPDRTLQRLITRKLSIAPVCYCVWFICVAMGVKDILFQVRTAGVEFKDVVRPSSTAGNTAACLPCYRIIEMPFWLCYSLFGRCTDPEIGSILKSKILTIFSLFT